MKFNITGPCVPDLHYMVDTSAKIQKVIRDYIEEGAYFTLNRPRQYGKTTSLAAIARALKGQYVVISLSFEGREGYFSSLDILANGIREVIYQSLLNVDKKLSKIFKKPPSSHYSMPELGDCIEKLCTISKKDVLLIIDEVDKASDYDVFVSFLGKLRDMYIQRTIDKTPTFKSVILAGVHDVKNLKKKIRPESEHVYNSPWNIAAPFNIDMSFSTEEITTMLCQYENDHHTGMAQTPVAERIHYWTSGYPFLVSDICKTIDDAGMAWSKEGVDNAAQKIISSSNLLFDDIIKNLNNYPTFWRLTRSLLLSGAEVGFDINNEDINFGVMYGVYSNINNKVAIANRIFETFLNNYYISKNETNAIISDYVSYKPQFVKGNDLNMETILDKFAAFMKQEYRDQDSDFIEREGRLLFLSFLRPIINGTGNYAVEPETRGSRRMDIAVFYNAKEYIIELKIWRGDSYEAEGLRQLAGYLKARGQSQGYLLSYANLKKAPRKGGYVEIDGVKLYEEIVAYKDKE
jgi:hypothetical protein